MIHSVPIEFYVMLAVVAAAVAASIFRPSERGPVSEFLLAGELSDGNSETEPAVELYCREDGSVELVRRSAPGVADDGAVSLAVKLIGQDLSIEERLVSGKGVPLNSTDASFVLRFLKRGCVYNIKYNSGSTSTFAAFTLRVVPGLKSSRPLRR